MHAKRQTEHVLFVVNTYPPRVGGLEKLINRLAVNLVRLGHQASVVTLDEQPSDVIEEGVRVIRLKGRFPIASVITFPAPGTALRIARQFVGEGVTAVSTQTRFFPMSLVGLSVARALNVPSIHTEHGSDYVKGVSPLIGIASRIVDNTVGRRILRESDRVLSETDQVASFVKRLSGRSSELFFNATDVTAAPQTAVESASPRFVFVGRLVPGKGWDDLLGAARILEDGDEVGPFSVEILGDGPDMPTLLSKIRSVGLSDIVVVRGQVSSDVVDRTLASAILVNPSRLSEGFQTSLLEALAAGSQIVTYGVPGALRLLADGAPVHIADKGSVSSLATQMKVALLAPMPAFPPEKLASWAWPERAAEFIGIVKSTKRRNN